MRLFFASAILCLSSTIFAAQQEFDAEIDALIGPLVEERLIPGYYVAVYGNNGLLFEKSSGLADDRSALPHGEDVLYFVESMSKPLTGLLMIRLQEQGKLRFDDPVDKYLPEFAGLTVLASDAMDTAPARPSAKVTIQQLLTHTSGFTNSTATGANPVVNRYRMQRVMTRNSIVNSKLGDLSGQVAKLAEFPLVFDPGSRFEYSVGYDIAGRIAEIVTGKDLAEAMHDLVFAPLGMRDSYFRVPETKHARMAQLYGPHGRTYQVPGKPKRYRKYSGIPKTQTNFGQSRGGYFSGTTGVLTTPRDYSQLLRLILNDGRVNGKQWLSKAGLQRLTANQLPAHVEPASVSASLPSITDSGYSFGLAVKVGTGKGVQVDSPSNYLYWASAANTQFFVDAEAGLAAMVITQHIPARYFFVDRLRALAIEHFDRQTP